MGGGVIGICEEGTHDKGHPLLRPRPFFEDEPQTETYTQTQNPALTLMQGTQTMRPQKKIIHWLMETVSFTSGFPYPFNCGPNDFWLTLCPAARIDLQVKG